ncbi:MAG: hypothetical protein H0X43_03015 [Nitrosospira sp.]|nr:hypothetical protein [Nitrosospira sp.]
MKNLSILKKKIIPSMIAAALALGAGAAGVAQAYEGMPSEGSDKKKPHGYEKHEKKSGSYKKDKDMDRRTEDKGAGQGAGGGSHPHDPGDHKAPPRDIGGPGNP